MTEIRPIRASEGDAFLQLLCDVFGLDFDRAHHVFYTEPLFDPERKWALVEGQRIVSILTTVPLQFGWGKAIGIAGVATSEDARQEGYAGRLLDRVLKESEKRGEGPALLFAKRPDLYAAHGFEVIDTVVRAPLRQSPDAGLDAGPLPNVEVEAIYNKWAEAEPARLRRDAQRWHYWQWGMRSGLPIAGGYFCPEAALVREAILPEGADSLPVMRGAEWLGLSTMGARYDLPLGGPGEPELLLMGHRFPGIPEMFMTDQF